MTFSSYFNVLWQEPRLHINYNFFNVSLSRYFDFLRYLHHQFTPAPVKISFDINIDNVIISNNTTQNNQQVLRDKLETLNLASMTPEERIMLAKWILKY